MKVKEKHKLSVVIGNDVYNELNEITSNWKLTTFRITKGFLVDLALTRLFNDLRTTDINEIISCYYGSDVNENY